jgi:hypothetical protein
MVMALAASAQAEVQVTVEPSAPAVPGGATVQLRWQQTGASEDTRSGCYWAFAGTDAGAVLASTGWDTAAFTAPHTDRQLAVRILAINKKEAQWRGTAVITVVPAAGPAPAPPALPGFNPLVTHWNRVPFLNVLPGPRLKGAPFGSGTNPQPVAAPPIPVRHLAGHGCPVQLRWHRPTGELASMLSVDEGDRVIHRSVPGQGAQEITVRDAAGKFLVWTRTATPPERWRKGTAPWMWRFLRSGEGSPGPGPGP